VVDHAPCAVLVARRERVRRILLADDGSDTAATATDLLISSGLFAGADVRVIAVASTPPILDVGIAPGVTEAAMEALAASLDASEAQHRTIASRTVERLREAGYDATSLVVHGAPAEEIVRVSSDVDLVVMGTRGHTGLTRLLLGSVARSVLLHCDTSVLVARPRPA
jgi:nucleotide-binding universal stress UspA family protein